jgi:hypothetical protein
VDVTKLDDIADKDNNDKNNNKSNNQNSSVNKLRSKKFFPPLANAWASGEGAEDSLFWVAYAAQNTNVQPSEVYSEISESNMNNNNQITVMNEKIKDEINELNKKLPKKDADTDKYMHHILGMYYRFLMISY